MFGLAGERPARGRRRAPARVGDDHGVRRRAVPLTGLVVDQQAALLAEGCLEPGDRQVHVRHRRVPARQRGRHGRALDAGLSTSRRLAARRARRPTAWTGRCTRSASAVRWLADLGVIAGADDLDRLGGAGRRRRRRRPSSRRSPASARPGGAATRAGALTGLRLDTDRGAPRARALSRASPRRSPSWPTAVAADLGAPLTTPARRRRPHPRRALLMQTQADLLQVPGRGVRLARRDRARRRAAVRPARPRPGRSTLADAVVPVAAGRGLRARDRRGRGGRAAGGPAAAAVAAATRRSRTRDRRRRRRTTSSVVGAGVVGAAIARELAQYGLRVALLEAADDVGDGHAQGQHRDPAHRLRRDARARWRRGWCARGYELLARVRRRAAGIPVERVGALLVAWDDEQLAALPGAGGQGRGATGTTRARLVAVDELYAREPHLGPGALGALEVPDESIICPWTTPLAFATEARASAASTCCSAPGRRRSTADGDGGHAAARQRAASSGTTGSSTPPGCAATRSTGCSATTTSRSRPRRGELIVFDKLARAAGAPHPAAGADGARQGRAGRADGLRQRDARPDRRGRRRQDRHRDRPPTGSTALLRAGPPHPARRCSTRRSRRSTPACAPRPSTATTRSGATPSQRYVCVGGIRSTGLTASMAIAEHVAGAAREAGLAARSRRTERAAAADAEHRRGVAAALPAAPT